jgi:formamidopyrimidine-DNA glycosylase
LLAGDHYLGPVPELVEVERYRQLAERVVGRTIRGVHAPDSWYLKRGLTARAVQRVLRGRSIAGTRRIGKLLLLDLDEGPVLGLRFGMSGRLVVDGTAGMDDLVYSSNRDDTAWDRFVIRFTGGGELRMRDPRRLGGVELDPDEARLGPDALTVTRRQLDAVLARTAAPLKARLMDQSKLAGVGNLAADEILWRAGLAPARTASGLDPDERARLHRATRKVMRDLLARGGSHTGDLMPERRADGHCPLDGTPLAKATVGGRTTWWCPAHQG